VDTLLVRDLKQISNHSNIISVSGGDEKMLELQVSTVPLCTKLYNTCLIFTQAVLTTLPLGENGFDQSEFEINLKVQQLKIYVVMQLMSQFMVYIVGGEEERIFIYMI